MKYKKTTLKLSAKWTQNEASKNIAKMSQNEVSDLKGPQGGAKGSPRGGKEPQVGFKTSENPGSKTSF